MRPLAILTLALVGCGGGGGGTPPSVATNDTNKPLVPAPDASPGFSLAWHPDSRKVDRFGSADGATKPDGAKDVVVVAEMDGPATALFVTTVTDKGEPTGDFQADTLVGDETQPIELSLVGPQGKTSAGLFVFEGDQSLNATDGSLKPIPSGHHKLTLYFADHPSVKDGIRLYALSPDGSLKKSPILK